MFDDCLDDHVLARALLVSLGVIAHAVQHGSSLFPSRVSLVCPACASLVSTRHLPSACGVLTWVARSIEVGCISPLCINRLLWRDCCPVQSCRLVPQVAKVRKLVRVQQSLTQLRRNSPVHGHCPPSHDRRPKGLRRAGPGPVRATKGLWARRQTANSFQNELRDLISGLSPRMDAIEHALSEHLQASKPSSAHFGISTPPPVLGAGGRSSAQHESCRETEGLAHPLQSFVGIQLSACVHAVFAVVV